MAGLGKATKPTTASVVVGLADIIAPAIGSLPGVVAPLRGGACKAFDMPFGDFVLDPSTEHTDALDFLPSIKVHIVYQVASHVRPGQPCCCACASTTRLHAAVVP